MPRSFQSPFCVISQRQSRKTVTPARGCAALQQATAYCSIMLMEWYRVEGKKPIEPTRLGLAESTDRTSQLDSGQQMTPYCQTSDLQQEIYPDNEIRDTFNVRSCLTCTGRLGLGLDDVEHLVQAVLGQLERNGADNFLLLAVDRHCLCLRWRLCEWEDLSGQVEGRDGRVRCEARVRG